jgi:hypothetical protein
MANEVLAEIDRQNIIFDVVDGIPPSGDETEEIRSFRSQIESDCIVVNGGVSRSLNRRFRLTVIQLMC